MLFFHGKAPYRALSQLPHYALVIHRYKPQLPCAESIPLTLQTGIIAQTKTRAKDIPGLATIERVTREFTPTQRLTLALAPRLVWALIMLMGRTWRFEVLSPPGVTPAFHGFTPTREIYCFWHQCVLACAFYYRSTHATILISQSFDGELITRTLQCFGYRAVRGSSSRGGREGLLALRRVLDDGTPAIFTADGPRGPIYQAKMGPIKLAQLTAAPIGSFHLEPEHCWTIRSWDRFQVPKPFTRIAVSWGEWTQVPSETPAESLETKLSQLDSVLNEARARAYAYLNKRPA